MEAWLATGLRRAPVTDLRQSPLVRDIVINRRSGFSLGLFAAPVQPFPQAVWTLCTSSPHPAPAEDVDLRNLALGLL
jgi:hypothetical protein